MERAGLEIDHWLVKADESIEFLKKKSAQTKAGQPPPLGTHLLMGENARDKFQNYLRNLIEDRVTIVLGMAHKLEHDP